MTPHAIGNLVKFSATNSIERRCHRFLSGNPCLIRQVSLTGVSFSEAFPHSATQIRFPKRTVSKAMSKQPPIQKINETGRRKGGDRRNQNVNVQVPVERRKTPRRRQIDPTTCEREYNDLEVEFMQALDQYKRDNGRMFPTCSEILEVVMKLGYRKVDTAPSDCCQSMATCCPSPNPEPK